jgi:cytochrome c553
MRKGLILLGLSGLLLASGALAQGRLPYWAYPVPTSKPGAAPKPDNTVLKSLPGAKKRFTEAGVNDRFNVPDWYPQDHPVAPTIVLHGRKPHVFACGYCHLPNGQGRPENASLAGQPADYIVQQVADMREGSRKSSTDKMGSINAMLGIAKASNDAEVRSAAEYFSKLKFHKWIRVVETDTVPKTEISSHNMLVKAARGGREPIGKRIIEMPENLDRIELRDPRTGFVAYVPKGAIARGRKLVDTGAGAFPCAACHGPTFKGNGAVPALAGRSPSELVRQLYDFKSGSRNGAGAAMMKPEVANMTDDMRLDIAAYLASLEP